MRDRFGTKIRIKSLDASNLLKPKEAIKALQRFQEYDFMLTESPCHRYDFEGTADIIIIPEPASLLLLSVGIVALRKRKA